MPTFTIESTYRLPVFRHRIYEAPTAENACQLAIGDDDWQSQKQDHESAGPTYLTGIWPGIDTAYEVAALPVPPRFAEGERLRDTGAGDLPATVPKMEPVMPRCRHCGSGQISCDANACWDEETQAWVLLATYDSQTCERCGADSNHLVDWVPLAGPGSIYAFLWDVIEALEAPKLIGDAAFKAFCREHQNDLTAEQAAATWRNRAPG
ncbi:hypothetical protein AWL63_19430 [Sphingomonas panacis]|uniref:Uncharacterized protein n=1 Tax=Sphingomonas panacis TaxID=1560345 RepID=A0A1B3ZED8_9SPHN|nr:hypothetical protein [Sphingomonas panacis]AOH85797.1 hypothetical protein AWL63_19430 [Sphingomonas panacis]